MYMCACRLAPHMGRRTGGQGVVVFAEHINSPLKLYAIKFFLARGSFDVERAAACNPVRRPCPPYTICSTQQMFSSQHMPLCNALALDLSSAPCQRTAMLDKHVFDVCNPSRSAPCPSYYSQHRVTIAPAHRHFGRRCPLWRE